MENLEFFGPKFIKLIRESNFLSYRIEKRNKQENAYF